jgi:hypothetical protein
MKFFLSFFPLGKAIKCRGKNSIGRQWSHLYHYYYCYFSEFLFVFYSFVCHKGFGMIASFCVKTNKSFKKQMLLVTSNTSWSPSTLVPVKRGGGARVMRTVSYSFMYRLPTFFCNLWNILSVDNIRLHLLIYWRNEDILQ